MRIFHRLLLGELIVPFFIGVFLFAVILLGDVARQIGSTILNARTPPLLIAQYLWLRTPSALVWSMPVGTLLAVSLAVARATRDGEINAMRAGGLSFFRICVPFIAAGAFATWLAFSLNEWVVPRANDAAADVFDRVTQTQPVVREERNQLFRDQEGRVFHVEHMNADTNSLENIVIWSFDAEDRLTGVVQAGSARLEGSVWWLYGGQEAAIDPETGAVDCTAFDTRRVRLWTALQDYYAEKRTAYEMSARELRDRVAALEAGGKSSQALAVELQFKYSLPAACIVFAIIGVPLAFRYARWGPFGGVLVAILIVFLYNGVRSWALAFGLAGALHPVVAGWLQNVLFGGLGLALVWRAGS